MAAPPLQDPSQPGRSQLLLIKAFTAASRLASTRRMPVTTGRHSSPPQDPLRPGGCRLLLGGIHHLPKTRFGPEDAGYYWETLITSPRPASTRRIRAAADGIELPAPMRKPSHCEGFLLSARAGLTGGSGGRWRSRGAWHRPSAGWTGTPDPPPPGPWPRPSERSRVARPRWRAAPSCASCCWPPG